MISFPQKISSLIEDKTSEERDASSCDLPNNTAVPYCCVTSKILFTTMKDSKKRDDGEKGISHLDFGKEIWQGLLKQNPMRRMGISPSSYSLSLVRLCLTSFAPSEWIRKATTGGSNFGKFWHFHANELNVSKNFQFSQTSLDFPKT